MNRQQRRYRAAAQAQAQPRRAALPARMPQAGMSVAYPPRPAPPPAPVAAPAERRLLCCGQWWMISHIPLPVPCCGRVWLQQTL